MAEEKPKKIPQSPNAQEEPIVTFTPEQIKLVDKMFDERLKSFSETMKRPDSPNAPVSLYNLRDPKAIDTVKVSRFEGKWVLGFKNIQMDPYKKAPKYLRYGVEPIRKLFNEPFVTLYLSTDGKKTDIQNVEIKVHGKSFFVQEKEVLLLDYMENRECENIDVIKCNVTPVIHDHGVLGRAGGQYGIAVDEKNNPESRPTILAQSKSEVRSFVVKLADVDEEIEYSTDFLG